MIFELFIKEALNKSILSLKYVDITKIIRHIAESLTGLHTNRAVYADGFPVDVIIFDNADT